MRSLKNLSNRLVETGRRAEGLAAIEEAVEMCRRLAQADPAAYEPDLATSLNNLRDPVPVGVSGADGDGRGAAQGGERG